MAISYDHATTGIFTQIGKVIYLINELVTFHNTLETRKDSIESIFQGDNKEEHLQPLVGSIETAQGTLATLRRDLVDIIKSRFQDKTSILDELGVRSDEFSLVISEFIKQMNADSETVDASTVSAGTISAGASNFGNGTVLVSKVLDGATAPASGFAPMTAYDGVDSEISIPETMLFECISDSYTDGATSGNEGFRWSGTYRESTNLFHEPEGGSGEGKTFNTVQSENILQNGTFENFTSDAPGSWNIDNGTAGTHIFQETTEVYRGSSSLHFQGDGAQATIKISQSSTNFTPRKRYCVGFRYKADATDTVSQVLTVQFAGTGYTAASSEKVEITGDNFGTSWTLQHFWINMPEEIPSDFELIIQATGTLTNGRDLYIDDLFVAPAEYNNGIAAVVVPGSDPFVREDRFTHAVTNDQAGDIQEFFRRGLKVQLPSDSGGTETIADSLITT